MRLGLGRSSPPLHRPSPFLARPEVWALRRWARGKAALPEVLATWWQGLQPRDQQVFHAHLARVGLVAWWGFWVEARRAQGPDEALQVSTAHQLALDQEGDWRGVRLCLSCTAPELHQPAPFMTRAEIWALRRWARGDAALPEVLVTWWACLPESDQHTFRAHLGRIGLVAWLGLWLEAGNSPDPMPDPEQPADDDLVGAPAEIHPGARRS